MVFYLKIIKNNREIIGSQLIFIKQSFDHTIYKHFISFIFINKKKKLKLKFPFLKRFK